MTYRQNMFRSQNSWQQLVKSENKNRFVEAGRNVPLPSMVLKTSKMIKWQRLDCAQGRPDLILAVSAQVEIDAGFSATCLFCFQSSKTRGLSPSQISIRDIPQICLPVRLINATRYASSDGREGLLRSTNYKLQHPSA